MARLLLIPESIFKRLIPDSLETKWSSEAFEVPYDVMEQRIKEIRKIRERVLVKPNNN